MEEESESADDSRDVGCLTVEYQGASTGLGADTGTRLSYLGGKPFRMVGTVSFCGAMGGSAIWGKASWRSAGGVHPDTGFCKQQQQQLMMESPLKPSQSHQAGHSLG